MALKHLQPDPTGWLPANSEIAAAVAKLDDAFDRAFNNFGSGAPETYLPLLKVRVHEEFPNMSALFLKQLQIDARERQKVQDAVAYAQPQVDHAVADMSDLVVHGKNLIDAKLGEANRDVMRTLRPATLQDATQARIVLTDLKTRAGSLATIQDRTLDSMKVPAERIEKWIEHVKALGPRPSGDQMVADDQSRKDTLAAADPGLKNGTTPVDQLFGDMFRTGDGVFLGRSHHGLQDDTMGQVAADQIMKHGKEIGAVFLEIPESYGPKIEAAMQAHRDGEIPSDLLPFEYRPDIPVINAAMKARVKVVPMDDEKGDRGSIGYPRDMPISGDASPENQARLRDRLAGANPYWAGVVEETMADPEMAGKKALILGGDRHSNTDGVEALLGKKYYSVDLASSPGENLGGAHNVTIEPNHAILSQQTGLPSNIFYDNATVFIRVK